MLTQEQAKTILKSIKFLDYIIQIGEQPHYLYITMKAPDTNDRRNVIELTHFRRISPACLHNPEIFIRAVYDEVVNVLRHEAAELFKVDGVAIFDEHKNAQQKFDELNGVIKRMYEKEPTLQYTYSSPTCQY